MGKKEAMKAWIELRLVGCTFTELFVDAWDQMEVVHQGWGHYFDKKKTAAVGAIPKSDVEIMQEVVRNSAVKEKAFEHAVACEREFIWRKCKNSRSKKVLYWCDKND